MLGPDSFLWPSSILGYVGLGPGQEFIPQFVAMLGLAATALLAILQWPITALYSRLNRRKKNQQNADDTAEPQPLGSEDKTTP